ncbi:MAG: CinA family protein [Oscillospiraceae bacterium]|nr:CinA family protein [Oscillospiraceae bacterium]
MSRLHTTLKKRGMTVTCAESCTGGLIAKLLTDPAGASAVFRGSFVTYCNETKHALLGVKQETLSAFGAVSTETAKEMAQGALERMDADLALSATGLAGPGSDESGKPVGTVCIGVALRGEGSVRVWAKEFCFTGTRAMIRLCAARAALRFAQDALDAPDVFFGEK